MKYLPAKYGLIKKEEVQRYTTDGNSVDLKKEQLMVFYLQNIMIK